MMNLSMNSKNRKYHTPVHHKKEKKSQVFTPGRCHPRLKHRTLDFHVGPVKGAHDGLDPVLVDFCKEHLDGLLGRRARRVRANGCGCSARVGCCGHDGLVEEQELDACAGDKARYVVVEELVDALEVPGSLRVSFRLHHNGPSWMMAGDSHLSVGPLHFLGDIEA